MRAGSTVLVTTLLSSCGLLKRAPDGSSPDQAILLDTIDLEISGQSLLPYRPAPDKLIDIHHIELDLRFDWSEKRVIGKAQIDLSPYFKAVDTIRLDAQGFEFKQVAATLNDSTLEVDWIYNDREIALATGQQLTVTDTLIVQLEYIATPGKVEEVTGRAIQSNRGLYFINPDGSDKDKPQQIWTQGETENNSTWFPSVDHPHEKFTQEIYLTVDTAFHTISNGRLVYSSLNADGTRTDYWKQELPHSNYLVMLAIGEFALVKDEWREKDVWYYLEEEYEPFAHQIFGNTPEMLSFFSKQLEYEYPWDKYHQVVVQDFVSGAMENTSAVIHGSFVQLTDRELLDMSHEDVIAHELFHHWFGDLVTCETWSQITLNEGFATYGEVLWQQHKYGEEMAMRHLRKDLDAYLTEAKGFTTALIRERYASADNVFDIHSYQKGGLVLHALRLEMGDSAFFESLQYYLREHEFGTVELADFRQACEHVSGRDLKWFFDQWYMTKGHPTVRCQYKEDSTTGILTVSLSQEQVEFPTFKMHVPFAVGYEDGTVEQHTFWMNDAYETKQVILKGKPLWYAVDPKGELLWELEEVKDSLRWAGQLEAVGPYFLRLNALRYLADTFAQQAHDYAIDRFNDPFWPIQQEALQILADADFQGDSASLEKTLTTLATGSPNSLVRDAALAAMDSLSFGSPHFFIQALHDSSYSVVRSCLSILLERDPCLAKDEIDFLEKERHGAITFWVSRIYATCADPSKLSFFDSAMQTLSGLDMFLLSADFLRFAVELQSEPVYDQFVERVTSAALNNDSWWERYAAVQTLGYVTRFYDDEIQSLEGMVEVTTDQTEHLAELRNKKANVSALLEEIKELQAEDDQPFRD